MANKKKIPFYGTEKAVEIKAALMQMEKNPSYHTTSSYTADGNNYPSHNMPFVDKHMAYIGAHPQTNPDQYLANLKLITRKR